jgi:cbb3-type cytochrome oxidase maturation protein
MIVLYITIGVTVVLAGLFLFIFLRSVKSGQYEDTHTPAVRMLFDDELVKEPQKPSKDSNTVKSI